MKNVAKTQLAEQPKAMAEDQNQGPVLAEGAAAPTDNRSCPHVIPFAEAVASRMLTKKELTIAGEATAPSLADCMDAITSDRSLEVELTQGIMWDSDKLNRDPLRQRG